MINNDNNNYIIYYIIYINNIINNNININIAPFNLVSSKLQTVWGVTLFYSPCAFSVT